MRYISDKPFNDAFTKVRRQSTPFLVKFSVIMDNLETQWHLVSLRNCCKIAEAQITKIDCKNILKIFKLTIGTKKINSK